MESFSHQLAAKNFRPSEGFDVCAFCKHSSKYTDNPLFETCNFFKYAIPVPKNNVCDEFDARAVVLDTNDYFKKLNKEYFLENWQSIFRDGLNSYMHAIYNSIQSLKISKEEVCKEHVEDSELEKVIMHHYRVLLDTKLRMLIDIMHEEEERKDEIERGLFQENSDKDREIRMRISKGYEELMGLK